MEIRYKGRYKKVGNKYGTFVKGGWTKIADDIGEKLVEKNKEEFEAAKVEEKPKEEKKKASKKIEEVK